MNSILILAIEDESVIRLKRVLRDAGYQLVVAEDLKPALENAFKKRPELIVLDFTSHRELDSQVIFRKLKKDRFLKDAPVFAIIPEDQSHLLDSIEGVSDFIFEPFRDSELSARVKIILRESISADSKDIIKIGDLVIDVARYEATLCGAKIEMTYKEYELLRFLAGNRGRVYSRDQLLDKIWGYDYYGGTRTVDVHIRRLRAKIEDEKHAFIETVRNVGYKFIPLENRVF
ncbi:MAG: response regulator transcription factor [Candidatus Omnitrophota bacterium]